MKRLSMINHAKKMTIACAILAASVSFGASAFAFSDLKGSPAEAKINALQTKGLINGVTHGKFAPKFKLTFGQAVQFIVSGLELKSQPSNGSSFSKASDYFDKVSDKAWFAPAFLTAKQNGLSLDRSVNPNGMITRAQFAHLLTQALISKRDFPVTEMYFSIADGDKLPAEIANSLQILLNTHIISLEAGSKFRPNDVITRVEAAVWVYDAAEFAQKVIVPANQTPAPVYDKAEVSVVKAADGVNKVSLTVNNLPHPGYGLLVERIEFRKDKTAVIYYSVTLPDPDKIYPQVISKATVVTYLSDDYKPVAQYVPAVPAK
ncbi:S-layer homology domain-containing protein [Paenibacillus sp. BR2-3]|uniref:S-layer homology domain-containing protein n=1 Tax=Paenibacillus sp. BR2-3 TaxID=3048494 RepID=UPI003977AB5D